MIECSPKEMKTMKSLKSLARILFIAVVSAVTGFTVKNAFAQEVLTAWYPNAITVNGGGLPPALFTNVFTNINLVVYPMTKGAGIHTEATLNTAYGGNGWTNNTWIASSGNTEGGGILNSNYITYAIQAAPGYTVSFSTNFAYIHNSATGPTNAVLQYSTDGVNFSDLFDFGYFAGGASAAITNVLSGYGQLQNVPSTTTNYFRYVNWGASSSNGTWYINAPT